MYYIPSILWSFFRWEFVQYVLNNSPKIFDQHFKPIHLLCKTCGFDYNYILKFENIEAEEKSFAQEIGASEVLESKWENSNKKSMSDEELIKTYFDILSEEEIQKLYKIYEVDFGQFQYSLDLRELRLST